MTYQKASIDQNSITNILLSGGKYETVIATQTNLEIILLGNQTWNRQLHPNTFITRENIVNKVSDLSEIWGKPEEDHLQNQYYRLYASSWMLLPYWIQKRVFFSKKNLHQWNGGNYSVSFSKHPALQRLAIDDPFQQTAQAAAIINEIYLLLDETPTAPVAYTITTAWSLGLLKTRTHATSLYTLLVADSPIFFK
ncbi:hypothetical protein ACJX0J_018145, partial [Zea mays]